MFDVIVSVVICAVSVCAGWAVATWVMSPLMPKQRQWPEPQPKPKEVRSQYLEHAAQRMAEAYTPQEAAPAVADPVLLEVSAGPTLRLLAAAEQALRDAEARLAAARAAEQAATARAEAAEAAARATLCAPPARLVQGYVVDHCLRLPDWVCEHLGLQDGRGGVVWHVRPMAGGAVRLMADATALREMGIDPDEPEEG